MVARGLAEVQERLEGENLDEALQTMAVLGDGVEDCKEVEVIIIIVFYFILLYFFLIFYFFIFLQSLTLLIDQYIAASLGAAGDSAANLPDTSTLMEVRVGVGGCDYWCCILIS